MLATVTDSASTSTSRRRWRGRRRPSEHRRVSTLSGNDGPHAAAEKGRSSRLSLNAVFNAASNLAYYAVVVLITPIAIRALGEDGWGIWQLVGAVTSYSLLLNLGLNSALSYHISRSLAVNDLDTLGGSINNARLYLLAATAVLLALLAGGGRWLVDSLVEGPDADLAFTALKLAILLTAVTLPVRLFLSVLNGTQRYDLLAGFRIVAGILLLIAAVAGFGAGMGLLGFAVLMALAPAVAPIMAWLASRRILPRECFRWRRPEPSRLADLLRYSLNTAMYTTGTVILYQTMKFLAAWHCGGLAAAGHMGLAVSLVQTLSVVFIPLAAVLQPRISDLHARGRDRELPGLLMNSLGATGLVAVPTVVFLVCEARTVFDAWVGSAVPPEVAALLARTVRFMVAGQGIYVVFLPCFYVLLGMGRHRIFGLGMLAAGVVNTGFGWFATRVAPTIDVLGLVLGCTLAALALLVTLPITLRHFSLGPGPVFRDSILLPLVASIPGALALQWIPRLERPILDLAFAGIVFGVCTLPGWILGRRRLGARAPQSA